MSGLKFLYHSLESNKYIFFIKLWKLYNESCEITMLVAFSLTFKGRRLEEEAIMCFLHRVQEELSKISPC